MLASYGPDLGEPKAGFSPKRVALTPSTSACMSLLDNIPFATLTTRMTVTTEMHAPHKRRGRPRFQHDLSPVCGASEGPSTFFTTTAGPLCPFCIVIVSSAQCQELLLLYSKIVCAHTACDAGNDSL